MKLLLIEPDKILSQSAANKFAHAGYKVIVCHTAQSALDALDRHPPDVIVLEPQLGIHNGIEFLYEMRSYNEWQSIPVIIYTLNSNALNERFIKPLSQLGAETILYKPHTSTNKLVQAVGQYTKL